MTRKYQTLEELVDNLSSARWPELSTYHRFVLGHLARGDKLRIRLGQLKAPALPWTGEDLNDFAGVVLGVGSKPPYAMPTMVGINRGRVEMEVFPYGFIVFEPATAFEQWRDKHLPDWVKRWWPIRTRPFLVPFRHVNCRCWMTLIDEAKPGPQPPKIGAKLGLE